MEAAYYQRIRLWSGITSIGANLALIWGLAWALPCWMSECTGFVPAAVALFAAALLMTLANLPFDLLSGHAVESAAGRTQQGAGSWLRDWVKARFSSLIGLWIGMMYFAVMSGASSTVVFWFVLGAGLVVILLFLSIPAGCRAAQGSIEEDFERKLALEVGALGTRVKPVRWFDHGDLETVNGCITPRGDFSLSTTVAKLLTPREAALLSAREEYFRRSGISVLVLGIVAVWTLSGICLAHMFHGQGPLQAGLRGVAVMTSWCLLALFIWPSLNRWWMTCADAYLSKLTSPEEACSLLSKVERLNCTDITLPPAKKAIFHPIPPLQDRLSKLERTS